MPVRHTKPMLSADKTKSVDDLVKFAEVRSVLLSWKMDGLTLELRDDNGEARQAITRGTEIAQYCFCAKKPRNTGWCSGAKSKGLLIL